MPIIPKHIWGKETYKTIGERQVRRARSSAPARTRSSRVADRPVHPARRATPTTGARRPSRTRSTSSSTRRAGHDGPGAQGRRARLRPRPQRRPAQPAEDRPEHPTVAGKRQRLDPARLQRLRRRHRQDDPEGRPVHQGPARPGVPRCPRLRRRPKTLVDRVLGGYGDVGTTIVPPVLDQVARRTDHAAHVRHRDGQAEARRRRLHARCERASASTRKASRSPCGCSCPNSDANYPKAAAVHQGLVRPARDQGHDQVARLGGPRREDPAAGGRRRATPPTTTSSCGAGAARSTRTGCSRSSSASAIGASSDSQYCNPAYDQMYEDQLKAPTADARKAILAQMQNLIYDKAVYDILYYDANLEAYRTDRFAGLAEPADRQRRRRSSRTARSQYTQADQRRRRRRARRRREAAASAGTPGGIGAPSAAAATPAPSASGSGDSAGSTTPILDRGRRGGHRDRRGLVLGWRTVGRRPAAEAGR